MAPEPCGNLLPAHYFMTDILDSFEKAAQIAPFVDAIRNASGWAARLSAIKAYYREYERLNGDDYTGADPYEGGLFLHLTPIENLLWQDLRPACRAAFVMQYPVGPYFLDFACPTHRIAVEADGRGFHDPDRDQRRDSILWHEHGWKVYRVTGTECHRTFPSPAQFVGDYYETHDEEPPEDEVKRAAEAYFLRTSSGVVRAIRFLELQEERAGSAEFEQYMRHTLDLHRLARFPIGR